MENPTYIRPPDYLYSLTSHPEYHFWTGAGGGKQGLWGVGNDEAVLLIFLGDGQFESITRKSWHEFSEDRSAESYARFIEFTSSEFARGYGFEEQPIAIKRIWLGELRIGIEDLTGTMKELLVSPDTLDEEETQNAVEGMEEWKSDGKFVFWWNEEFYMSAAGEVETS